MDVLSLYVGNDMMIEVEGLTNEATGQIVNDAAVAVTLLDTQGNQVGGQVWPLTMGYVAETDGIYRATLADTLGVVVNTRYLARITADAGSGRRSEWDIDVLASRRRR